jgi:hypothetical protein
MAKKELVSRVRELMDAGHTTENIINILKSEGYAPEDVDEALKKALAGKGREEEKGVEAPVKIKKARRFEISTKLLVILVVIVAAVSSLTAYFLKGGKLPSVSTPTPTPGPAPSPAPTQGPVTGMPGPTPGGPTPSVPSTGPTTGGNLTPTTPSGPTPGGGPTGPTGPSPYGTVCGNGICEAGEDASTCPQDCIATGSNATGGSSGPAGPTYGVCGNGICEAGEDASTCPQDCVPT